MTRLFHLSTLALILTAGEALSVPGGQQSLPCVMQGAATPSSTLESLATNFTNVRGVNYIPTYRSLAGTPGFYGVSNPTAMWHFYDPTGGTSNEVANQLRDLKDMGVNSIRVFLSHLYWLHHPVDFQTKLQHFLGLCQQVGLWVMPVLWDDHSLSALPPDYLNYSALTNFEKWQRSPGSSVGTTMVVGLPDPGGYYFLIDQYLLDAATAAASSGVVFLWDVMNEPEPSVKWQRLLIERALQTLKLASLPTTVGAKAWPSDTVAFPYHVQLANDPNLDVLSFHPYGHNRETVQTFFDAAMNALTTPKPLLVNEVGAPGLVQPYRDVIEIMDQVKWKDAQSEVIGAGFMAFKGTIGWEGGNHPYNQGSGFFYFDGTCRDVADCVAFREAALSDGIPMDALTSAFCEKQPGATGYIDKVVPGYLAQRDWAWIDRVFEMDSSSWSALSLPEAAEILAFFDTFALFSVWNPSRAAEYPFPVPPTWLTSYTALSTAAASAPDLPTALAALDIVRNYLKPFKGTGSWINIRQAITPGTYSNILAFDFNGNTLPSVTIKAPFSNLHRFTVADREFVVAGAYNGILFLDATDPFSGQVWFFVDNHLSTHRGFAAHAGFVYAGSGFQPGLRVFQVTVTGGSPSIVDTNPGGYLYNGAADPLGDPMGTGTGVSPRLTVDGVNGTLYVPSTPPATVGGHRPLKIFDISSTTGQLSLLGVWQGSPIPSDSFDVHLHHPPGTSPGTTWAYVSSYSPSNYEVIYVLDVTTLPTSGNQNWVPANWTGWVSPFLNPNLPGNPPYDAHSAWVTPDSSYLYESYADLFVAVYDLQSSAYQPGPQGFQASPPPFLPWSYPNIGSVHHLHGLGFTGYLAHWERGVVIADLERDGQGVPTGVTPLAKELTLVQTDEVPGPGTHKGVFAIDTSSDPGILYATDRFNGLFVLQADLAHVNRFATATTPAGATSDVRITLEGNPPHIGATIPVTVRNVPAGQSGYVEVTLTTLTTPIDLNNNPAASVWKWLDSSTQLVLLGFTDANGDGTEDVSLPIPGVTPLGLRLYAQAFTLPSAGGAWTGASRPIWFGVGH
ncbi:MAG: hypothetical protein H6834_12055 [Planctomycetes bacterium]|nr:hypothetical protein [Planctomycetota bacterium]